MVELLHLDQAREMLARGASARAAVSGT
jgi:hypothetical protein